MKISMVFKGDKPRLADILGWSVFLVLLLVYAAGLVQFAKQYRGHIDTLGLPEAFWNQTSLKADQSLGTVDDHLAHAEPTFRIVNRLVSHFKPAYPTATKTILLSLWLTPLLLGIGVRWLTRKWWPALILLALFTTSLWPTSTLGQYSFAPLAGLLLSSVVLVLLAGAKKPSHSLLSAIIGGHLYAAYFWSTPNTLPATLGVYFLIWRLYRGSPKLFEVIAAFSVFAALNSYLLLGLSQYDLRRNWFVAPSLVGWPEVVRIALGGPLFMLAFAWWAQRKEGRSPASSAMLSFLVTFAVSIPLFDIPLSGHLLLQSFPLMLMLVALWLERAGQKKALGGGVAIVLVALTWNLPDWLESGQRQSATYFRLPPAGHIKNKVPVVLGEPQRVALQSQLSDDEWERLEARFGQIPADPVKLGPWLLETGIAANQIRAGELKNRILSLQEVFVFDQRSRTAFELLTDQPWPKALEPLEGQQILGLESLEASVRQLADPEAARRWVEDSFRVYKSTDLPHGDYFRKEMPLGSAEECRNLCEQNSECLAYVYEHRIPGGGSRCNLKREQPKPSYNGCCTSGVRQFGALRLATSLTLRETVLSVTSSGESLAGHPHQATLKNLLAPTFFRALKEDPYGDFIKKYGAVLVGLQEINNSYHRSSFQEEVVVGPNSSFQPGPATNSQRYMSQRQFFWAWIDGRQVEGVNVSSAESFREIDDSQILGVDVEGLAQLIVELSLEQENAIDGKALSRLRGLNFYDMLDRTALRQEQLKAGLDELPEMPSYQQLKRSLQNLVDHSGRKPKALLGKGPLEMLRLVDFPGNTLKAIKVPQGSEAYCAALCERNSGCVGVTYEHEVEDEARCNLKAKVFRVTPCANCSSAIKPEVLARLLQADIWRLAQQVRSWADEVGSQQTFFHRLEQLLGRPLKHAEKKMVAAYLKPVLWVLGTQADAQQLSLFASQFTIKTVNKLNELPKGRVPLVFFQLEPGYEFMVTRPYLAEIYRTYPDPAILPEFKFVAQHFNGRGFRVERELRIHLKQHIKYLSPAQTEAAVERARYLRDWRMTNGWMTTHLILPDWQRTEVEAADIKRIEHLLGPDLTDRLKSLAGSRFTSLGQFLSALGQKLEAEQALQAFALLAPITQDFARRPEHLRAIKYPLRPFHELNNPRFELPGWFYNLDRLKTFNVVDIQHLRP